MHVSPPRRVLVDLSGYWKLLAAIFPEAGRRPRNVARPRQPAMSNPKLVRQATLDRRLVRGRVLAMIEDSDKRVEATAVKGDLKPPNIVKRKRPEVQNSVRRP
jgi:hypothetical protein